MGRPSKLTPEQWAEIERRLLSGEGCRALAGEFGISPAQVSKRFPNSVAKSVHAVAEKLADAHTALAALPVTQQTLAMSLSDKLRNISESLAAGAELGAKNFHRLSSLANGELQKVDDAEPAKSEASLRTAAALTKMANDAAATPINLLAANKDRMKADEQPEGAPASVLVVPGLMADSASWSAATQAATKGQ